MPQTQLEHKTHAIKNNPRWDKTITLLEQNLRFIMRPDHVLLSLFKAI